MAGDALTFRVAFVVRWLLWGVRFVVIWPLATMALMALFVLWKDNTTPGKLLVKEINFVRQTAPAGQFPVSECWFSSSDSSGRSEIQDICLAADQLFGAKTGAEKHRTCGRYSQLADCRTRSKLRADAQRVLTETVWSVTSPGMSFACNVVLISRLSLSL